MGTFHNNARKEIYLFPQTSALPHAHDPNMLSMMMPRDETGDIYNDTYTPLPPAHHDADVPPGSPGGRRNREGVSLGAPRGSLHAAAAVPRCLGRSWPYLNFYLLALISKVVVVLHLDLQVHECSHRRQT